MINVYYEQHTIILFIFRVLDFAKSHNLNVHKYDPSGNLVPKISLLSYVF